MSEPVTFLTLPPELRTIVYEHVALTHQSRQVHVEGKTCYTTTSALVATCRLISSEYADAAWSAVTELCFLAKDINFGHVLRFMRKLDKKHFAILRRSKVNIYIELHFTQPHDGEIDKLGRWLSFCAQWGGTTSYCVDYERDDFCMDGVVEFLKKADPTMENKVISEIHEAIEHAQEVHQEWRERRERELEWRKRQMRKCKYYSTYRMH